MPDVEGYARIFIVLGVARSGTSLAAGMLSALGVEMNETINPSAHNPRGAFEDVAFVGATKRLVRGGEREDAERGLAALIAQREDEAAGARWGWKSALTHHVWGAVRKCINARETGLVIVTRSEDEVVRSFLRHRERFGERVTMREAEKRVRRSRRMLENVMWDVRQWPWQLHVTYQMMRVAPLQVAEAMKDVFRLEAGEEGVRKAVELVLPTYHSWEE